MIKNVIFDLGNVLLSFNPQDYLRTKIDDENKVQQVYREIFLSDEWPMLDRGVVTEEKAITRMIERSLENGELIKRCMNNWYEILTPMEESIAILKDVKARGYKIFILSNFHDRAYENVTKRCDFFKYFDGGIISYREKLLKPEMEMYNRLTSCYNVKPSESIFIDDAKANIEGAGKIGFKTILFTDAMNLRNELIGLGILEK